ncbi:MAG: radical SAM protein [Ruminococcaceae bacterium]|nr:radical SAM protein [Oscillospiraceae bacterium]
MIGYIHSFESLAALDGGGLRFAVFLSACPMRCAYCHNPDTWDKGSAALKMTPEELVKKASRYKPYFKNGGGVTFVGGEPLVQADFIAETVPLLREAGISYVVDTSGAVELTESVKYVLSSAERVLLDLKFWDEESYIKYTKQGMDKVLKTLDFLESIGKKTVIRTVVIPDINDSEEIIEKYLPYVRDKKCVERYELLAFHTMGFFKYEKLGIENPFADKIALDKAKKDELQAFVDKKLDK